MRPIFVFIIKIILTAIYSVTCGLGGLLLSLIMWDSEYFETVSELSDYLWKSVK
jgi:hypothetical protein